MAKIEAQLKGNFDVILDTIHKAVMNNSSSASFEDSSYFLIENCRCSVRAYERYSYMGKGRVSMNVTLIENNGVIYVSAITTGGSQAMFFKLNTFGEESFLETVRNAIDTFRI